MRPVSQLPCKKVAYILWRLVRFYRTQCESRPYRSSLLSLLTTVPLSVPFSITLCNRGSISFVSYHVCMDTHVDASRNHVVLSTLRFPPTIQLDIYATIHTRKHTRTSSRSFLSYILLPPLCTNTRQPLCILCLT